MNICVTGRGSKEVDRWCIEKIGIPSVVLMERAAMSVCEEILKELSDNENGKVFICCGTGNNGADGLAVGRILLNKGINTHIYILGNMDKSSQEFMLQYNILNNIKANVTMLGEEVPDNVFFDNNEINVAKLNNNDIIVDAIFGIGLSRNVEGKYRNIIEKINASGKKVISIDIPSGLCADRGVVMGCSVKADKTVTFGKMKAGLVLCYGKDYSGEVVVKDVGFLEMAYNREECKKETYQFYEKEDLKIIPDRKKTSNKGTYRTVTVIAGSENMSGAAIMCAKSVYRCGAGIVKVLTHKECLNVVKNNIYEVIVADYNKDFNIDKNDIVVIGPGISVCDNSREMVKKTLRSRCKVVLDADGLNVISSDREMLDELHENVIITPHIKEMSRLCRESTDYIRENIVEVAKTFSEKYKCVTIIKDATTVIADNLGHIMVNMSGNSGMSTGGSGDVLSGIIGGMLSQNLPIYQSATMGVYLHGLAGDLAGKKLTEYGMMATDIIENIPEVIKCS